MPHDYHTSSPTYLDSAVGEDDESELIAHVLQLVNLDEGSGPINVIDGSDHVRIVVVALLHEYAGIGMTKTDLNHEMRDTGNVVICR